MANRGEIDMTETERLFWLFVKLIDDGRARIPYAEFSDEAIWGDDRTFRRLVEELGRLWEQHTHSPLFGQCRHPERSEGAHATVASEAQGIGREERYFQLVDPDVHLYRSERTGIFPAYLELLRVINGTLLKDDFVSILHDFTHGLDRSDELSLEKMDRKFFYFGKGMKSYHDKHQILTQIYTALIREQFIAVTIAKHGRPQEIVLRPLTLLMFNNSLYLTGRDEGQAEAAPEKQIRIERLLSAEVVKGSTFPYPDNREADAFGDGYFGFIRGDEAVTVELEFSEDPAVQRRARGRRWADGVEFTEMSEGTLRLAFAVDDLAEVQAWVLSFGDDCRVVGPGAFREQVVHTVDGMGLLYGG